MKAKVEHDMVALLFYNGNLFDVPLLLEYGDLHGVDVYESLEALGVTAVGDPRVWSEKMVAWPEDGRPHWPDAGGKHKPSHKQEAVFKTLFPGEEYESHTAGGDVDAMLALCGAELFVRCQAECPHRLFVSLGQHRVRQRMLLQRWREDTHGGFGRADRPLCRCQAVTATRVIPATAHSAPQRVFYCARVPRRDELERDGSRAGEGCAFQDFVRGPAYTPGCEPTVKPARAAVDNGVAGACTCGAGSSCLTAQKPSGSSGCPCRAAGVPCTATCHRLPSGKRQKCKCRNTTEGERLHVQEAADRQAAVRASSQAAARAQL